MHNSNLWLLAEQRPRLQQFTVLENEIFDLNCIRQRCQKSQNCQQALILHIQIFAATDIHQTWRKNKP